MADRSLSGFIEEVTGESHLRVEEDLGGGFVRLRSSEAERRQAQQDIRCCEDIVLELLRNARDAGAHLIYLATGREGVFRNIVALDDGCGIPRGLWEKVFEPRVTSKLDSFRADQWGVHGRGMALFSIACNTVEHRIASSGEGLGSAVAVKADTGALAERADQSSMPHLAKASDGRDVMRGPRNINRITAEFTLNERETLNVYLGSPSEVLATLVEHGRRAISVADRTFAADAQRYPICLRPALAGTPEELAEIAAGLGMQISSRSARRVLDGEVTPLRPFMAVLGEALRGDKVSTSGNRPRHRAQRGERRLRIAEADLEEFSRRVGEAYADLARDYYLDEGVQPEIHVGKQGIRVVFPLVEA